MIIENVKLDGGLELIRKSKKLQLQLVNENRRVFRIEALRLQVQMRINAPIKTGLLRGAIDAVKVVDKGGAVGYYIGITRRTDRPEFRKGGASRINKSGKSVRGQSYYPASQEFGWAGHPGHPYMRKTFHQQQNKIKASAKLAYKKVIKSVA